MVDPEFLSRPEDRPAHVLIAGGGIAALELLLALRANAGSHVAITMLTAEAAPSSATRPSGPCRRWGRG